MYRRSVTGIIICVGDWRFISSNGTKSLAAAGLMANGTSSEFFERFHAARFARLSHFGSITARLPVTLGRDWKDQ
jgi:hypothetical protein